MKLDYVVSQQNQKKCNPINYAAKQKKKKLKMILL